MPAVVCIWEGGTPSTWSQIPERKDRRGKMSEGDRAFVVAMKIEQICCNCHYWECDFEHGRVNGICKVKYDRLSGRGVSTEDSLTRFDAYCSEPNSPLAKGAVPSIICNGSEGCQFVDEMERRIAKRVMGTLEQKVTTAVLEKLKGALK